MSARCLCLVAESLGWEGGKQTNVCMPVFMLSAVVLACASILLAVAVSVSYQRAR